ncbi:hypothetical protein DL767_001047 [Monosporascus sp. MG133]|nr:hypothetical protein DL767_001047 [Monosporascus sp. MG133]
MDASLWPSPRSNGRPSSSNDYATRECINEQPELRRQQSVRFIRPRPPPMTKASTATGDVTPTRGIGPGSAHTTETTVYSRFKSSPFASGMASAAKGTAGDYINALITSEEYYTPEDDIASVPSSYRRIPKSRSMYTSSEPSAVAEMQSDRHFAAMTNGFPSSGGSMAPLTDENKPPSRLKAPKSMSFLRNRRDQYAAFPFSQDSMSCRSKPAGDKVFKKSLRDVGNAPQSTSLKVPKDGGLRDRARKVSQGFKHKLKNLLNLSKGDNADDMTFPPQQIQASTTHNAEIEIPANRIDDTFLAEPPTDEGALSHVTSGVPSLHTVPSNQQLRSRQGSLESLRSERKVSDERSRATSWSNSEISTVTSTNSLKKDWERQRLSIIKENGTHVSSSSAKRAPAVDHSIQPNISVIPLQQPVPKPVAIMDGQRIYSALMKRVNGKQKQPQNKEPKNSSCNSISTGGDFPKPPKTDGATVFVDPPVYRPAPPVPPKNRVVSSTSSVEWKTWLSANTSKLEGSPGRSEHKGLYNKLPSMPLPSRHIRERTQITDEDEDEYGDEGGHLDVYQPTRPDTMVAPTEHGSKRSTYLPHPMSKFRFEPSSCDKENEAPQPPPIPPRNILRISPSLVSVESRSGQSETPMGSSKYASVNSKPQRPLAHVQSLNSLGGSQLRGSGRLASRLPRRQSRAMDQSGITPSPGIAAAVDEQFGMLGSAATTRRKAILETPIKSENVSPRTETDRDLYGEGGSDIISPEPGRDPRETGGQRMVDMFLSSRRRRMASSEDGSVFL